MKLRTYLVLSYLAVIVVVSLGSWLVYDHFIRQMSQRDLAVSDNAIGQVTAANIRESERILTQVGEYIVADKADDVVRELTHVLAGRNLKDYARLRRDPQIRRIALQKITGIEGVAGYTDLYDKRGYILFHPDKRVEGQNQLDWEEQYPETTDLIKRSFTEDRVSGYFNFFDVQKKERKRFSVRVHVPGTPFIVAAIVNIDEYFQPVVDKMAGASLTMIDKARTQIKGHQANISRQVTLGSLGAGLALCLLCGAAGLWFAAAIARPIARLRDGVQKVGEGNFAVAVPERGVREVAQLAHSFNELGEQLTDYMEKRDFIRDTFGRYVTHEVVKKLLESREALEMGGETREVSLIMSDLRGFTAITAEMDPEEVITFLNRYLSRMIEILLDHQAVIDEILGDGILAFFGAPEPLEDHPARAVACALAMQAAMDEINAANEADGFPRLAMGIGVNTGRVVVGNIGSERRTKYSVVGSDVNFASRMESYALGGQVLISSATYQRVKDLVEVGEALPVEMKGVPGLAKLYEVNSIGGTYHQALRGTSQPLAPLAEPIKAEISFLKDKIVEGEPMPARITHRNDSEVQVTVTGLLRDWDEVRLTLVNEGPEGRPHAYGKVTGVRPDDQDGVTGFIRFTSVPPAFWQKVRQKPEAV